MKFYVIFKHILVIDGWGISCEIALKWLSLDCTDNQSTLVQVMVWCRQAISHYLSQYWLRSVSPYGVTRPQRVKLFLGPDFRVYLGIHGSALLAIVLLELFYFRGLINVRILGFGTHVWSSGTLYFIIIGVVAWVRAYLLHITCCADCINYLKYRCRWFCAI